jgi:hypothetical protein
MVNSLRDDFRKRLAVILTPEQVKRFEQVVIQIMGIHGLADRRRELGLSPDQVTRIGRLQGDQTRAHNEAARNAFTEGARDAAAVARSREKDWAIRREFYERALKELSAEQRKTWDSLIGPPYKDAFTPLD